MRNKIICLLFLSLPLFLIAENDYNKTILINGTHLKIEIAENENKRAIGLMYRKTMPKDCGMLFIFPAEELLSFWMKNTYIPLSIAFIDDSGLIIDIKDMVPLSEESVFSKGYALYALEVNLNWFKNNNIKVGDRIQF